MRHARCRESLSTAIISLFFVPLATSAQILVGVIVPIERPSATLGKSVVDGTALAIQVINAHGGINGKKLELEARDDSCSPSKARQLTQELLQKGVVALFGYRCSFEHLVGPVPCAN